MFKNKILIITPNIFVSLFNVLFCFDSKEIIALSFCLNKYLQLLHILPCYLYKIVNLLFNSIIKSSIYLAFILFTVSKTKYFLYI